MRYFPILYVILCLCVLPVRLFAADLFTVEDITVGGTGATAKEARATAMQEGEKKALGKLFRRITPALVHHALPQLESEEIASLVQEVEVKEEKITSNHYKATLNITFNQDLVRRTLQEAGIAYTDEKSEPLVVLPVLYDNGQMLTWDQPNAWLESWRTMAASGGFVPLIIPDKQASDFADIAVEKLLSEDYTIEGDVAMQEVLRRHGAQKLLLAEARYSLNPMTQNVFLQVYLTSISKNGIEKKTRTFSGDQGVPLTTVLIDATQNIAIGMEKSWKQGQSSKQSSKLRVTVSIPLTDLVQWHTLEKRLEGFDFIEKTILKQVSIKEALVDLHFQTSYQELVYALIREGLILENVGDGLVLKEYAKAQDPNNIW